MHACRHRCLLSRGRGTGTGRAIRRHRQTRRRRPLDHDARRTRTVTWPSESSGPPAPLAVSRWSSTYTVRAGCSATPTPTTSGMRGDQYSHASVTLPGRAGIQWTASWLPAGADHGELFTRLGPSGRATRCSGPWVLGNAALSDLRGLDRGLLDELLDDAFLNWIASARSESSCCLTSTRAACHADQ